MKIIFDILISHRSEIWQSRDFSIFRVYVDHKEHTVFASDSQIIQVADISGMKKHNRAIFHPLYGSSIK